MPWNIVKYIEILFDIIIQLLYLYKCKLGNCNRDKNKLYYIKNNNNNNRTPDHTHLLLRNCHVVNVEIVWKYL